MNTDLKTHSRFSTWLYGFTIFLFLLHFEALLPFGIRFSPSVVLAQEDEGGGEDANIKSAPALNFEIGDFTGGAHLNYPIVLPPARDGLAPNLSFFYTNTGGNSWVGIGWDLSAGFIQRRGVRKGVPKYNDTDVFELQLGSRSPQELVSIGAGQYRLKIDGAFLKIMFHSGAGENYWEVWDKSGVKMRFGAGASSRIGRVKEPVNHTDTYRWFLDRVDDPKTNYMELIYFRDQDSNNTYQIYLQEIRYNGQVSSGLPHNHSVFFNLDESPDRPDPIYNYRGAFKMLTRKRLSSVEVKTNGALVRKYKLQYKDVTSYNTRSLLSQVTLYGNDGTTSLPPTKFSYYEIDSDITKRGFGEAVSWDNPSAWGARDGNLIQNNYLIPIDDIYYPCSRYLFMSQKVG